MNKINPFRIISDHFRTLKEHGSTSMGVGDAFIFFLIPMILAGVSFWREINFKAETVNIIVTAFSVFAALLFNLLMLIYGLVQRKDDSNESRLKATFLKEIYSNISFTVFVSLLIIVVAVVAMTFAAPEKLPTGTGSTAVGLVYTLILVFLMSHFLLTLLMVLKRVHILLAKEFAGSSAKA